jgi:hypothetical protein
MGENHGRNSLLDRIRVSSNSIARGVCSGVDGLVGGYDDEFWVPVLEWHGACAGDCATALRVPGAASNRPRLGAANRMGGAITRRMTPFKSKI